MSFEIPENTTDILVSNEGFGRIGLTAGIDLPPSVKGISIFQLGFPSVGSFQEALDKGAKAHIINKTISIKCTSAGEITASAVSTPHDQVIGGEPIKENVEGIEEEGDEEETETTTTDVVPPTEPVEPEPKTEEAAPVAPVVPTPAPVKATPAPRRR